MFFEIPRGLALTAAGILYIGCAAWLGAATIEIPNASFESPAVDFADSPIDFWQKSPQPVWWDEPSFGPWTQLTGLFNNYDPEGMTNFIDNCDGNQVMFLFSVPEVAIFQDYTTTYGTNTAPTRAFDAQYQAGKSYRLTFGVLLSGSLPPMEGATLEASLYYRDAASNMITVAATTVTSTASVFTNSTHLIDFQVDAPAVQPDDAWAGQHIGVQFRSTVGFDLQGGVWDLDHVRLAEFGPPVLREMARTDGETQFLLESMPGLAFEILASTNLTLPLMNWTRLGNVTNTAGTVPFNDATADLSNRYYRARQLP